MTRKKPRKPSSQLKTTIISFRIPEALVTAGREIPHFEANFSFFARAAVENFMAQNRIPLATREITRQLDTKSTDVAQAKVTRDQKRAFKRYAADHNTTLGGLFNSAIGHALGVLQF